MSEGPARADVGYRDQSFSGTSTPTGTKRAESLLWWNDGSWWADMWDNSSQDFHIFRLDTSTQRWIDTGQAIDTRANTHADVLWDDSRLYVASHAFVADGEPATSGTPSYLYRFSYDPVTKQYSLDSGFPVVVNNYKTETLVIDKDSTGKLWATWQQGNQIYVNRTVGDDRTWGTPFVLPTSGTSVTVDDASAVLAFGGDKIGVMWSNQSSANDAMYFSVHQDGQSDTAWGASRTAIQGPQTADDHINLKSLQADGSGRVFAAVKTSFTTSSAPLIMLLVRDASSGDWSSYPVARVSDCPNRPLVLIDEENQVLHVFATYPGAPGFSCNSSGGAIHEKTSPLANISFPTGAGTTVIEDSDSPFVHNVTSTKQNVNSRTGIAVLASDTHTGFYWHAYQSIAPAQTSGSPIAGFTASPTSGVVPLAVSFTDTSTGGPTSWSWDFGDGTGSTLQHPTHTYSEAGTYVATLTAGNAFGSSTATQTISAAPASPPIAQFTAAPTSGQAPLAVRFTDTSSGTPTSWSWDFGDGTSSAVQNPTHTFSAPGEYSVILTATNAYGSSTASHTVTATPPPPDFALDASPSSRVVVRPGSTSYTVTASPSNAFSGNIDLSVSGLPSGAGSTFTPNPLSLLSGQSSSTLTVTTTSATKLGSYTLTITGAGGGSSHVVSVSLQVKRK